MIAGIFTKLKAEFAFIVLVIVAAIGAWFYVEAQRARADRDRVLHWAEVTCAASGADYAPAGKAAPGQACAAQVAGLARFKTASDERTAQALAQAMAEHDARQNTDTQAARLAAEAARSAALRMEAADAEAERKNLVDREWFAAVNGVAGLRAASTPAR